MSDTSWPEITRMDLRQQLVIWKKATYLQDNIALSPKFCACLVDEDIFTVEQMHTIQSKEYNAEKLVLMLSMLGSHGDDIFEKFVRALTNSDLPKVANELVRTEKKIKFGEMLPPSFTYFMDMSEYLRKYSHISYKLGEEGKLLLEKFIAGKLEVENRKRDERLKFLEAERLKMRDSLDSGHNGLSAMEQKEKIAADKINQAEEMLEQLKSRMKEVELINKQQREELRRLKQLHKQQSDLNNYLDSQCSEYVSEQFPPSTQDSTEADLSQVSPEEMLRVRLLESQINLQVLKLDLIRTSLNHLDGEEYRVQDLLKTLEMVDNAKPKSAANVGKELKSFSSEMEAVRTQLEQQLRDGEQDLLSKQQQLSVIEDEHHISTQIRIQPHTDLLAKLQTVIENMKRAHHSKLGDIAEYHNKECNDFLQQIEELNKEHENDVFELKEVIRAKMHELHRREQLHKRLRYQISVVTRNHAKNMNATISVEECRKVVRGVIRDARKLRKIADADLKEKETDTDNEHGETSGDQKPHDGTNENDPNRPNTAVTGGPTAVDEHLLDEKKKKKKRRIPESLSDLRLRYISDKIGPGWRKFGRSLGITNNRMDMVQMDHEGAWDKYGFYMLKVWRDEEKGKIEDLMEALEKTRHKNIVGVVVPKRYLRQPKNRDDEESLVDESEITGGDGNPGHPAVPKLPVIFH